VGFSNIVGHTRQLESLRAALVGGRLHHAYLFLGPEGIGKQTIAMALAQAIHCAAGNGDFCGSCDACVRIQSGNHPDVRLVGLLEKKKEIVIDQVRQLERELAYRSFSGKPKMAIIDPATLLNAPAQNALLKTLEEPPEQSILVLIASSGGPLLPTVRSRCLSLTFGPLPRDAVAEALIARGKAPDEATLLAALSIGSLGAAMMIESEGWLEKRRNWGEIIGALEPGDYRGAMAAAETIAGDRVETLKFLEWAGSWYRDLMVYAVTRDADKLANPDLIERIETLSAKTPFDRLLWLFSQIGEAAGQVQRNVNRRMIIEKLLFGAVKAG